MTTSKFDMRYGRQGGRIVPFAAEAHDRTRLCGVCGQTMVNTEATTHRECAPAEPDDALTLFPSEPS